MPDDLDLLRLYVENHSEPAFSELVERHVPLVYGAAFRRLNGDGHAAKDVTQEVFRQLAAHATSLRRHPHLVGWLFKSTHFAAANFVRTEGRRRIREQEALTMNDPNEVSENAVDWAQLRPLLDDAMLALSDDDREALLRRFFQGRKLAEIAEILAVSEDAARMRIDRALERLRVHLERHKITSTASALGILLANTCCVAAPVGLAAVVSSGAITAAAGVTAAAGGTALFTMSKITIGITGLVALAAITGLVLQQRANEALRRDLAVVEKKHEAELTRLRPRSAAEAAKLPAAPQGADASATARSNLSVAPKAPIEAEPSATKIQNFSNVGRSTPKAAIQTFFWSIQHADLREFAHSVEYDDEAKRAFSEVFATLSPKAQAFYATPAIMAAAVRVAHAANTPTEIEISESAGRDSNEARIHYTGNGKPRSFTFVARKVGDEWKMVGEGRVLSPSERTSMANAAEAFARTKP